MKNKYKLSKLRLELLDKDILEREKICYKTIYNKELPCTPVKKDGEFCVYIMCGIPGAGKSTYTQNYLSDKVIISIDEIRCELGVQGQSPDNDLKRIGNPEEEKKVFEVYYNKLIECCKNKQDCVLDNLNITKESRKEILDRVEEYNPIIKIVYIEPEDFIETCSKRRTEHNKGIFYGMNSILEFPESDEYNELIIYKS